MANYHFLKNAEVYFQTLDSSGAVTSRIFLDVQKIRFNQTYTDKTYRQKTIHDENKVFDASSITKANPASFDLTLNVLEESTYNPVYRALLDTGKFNLVVRTFSSGASNTQQLFKLTTAVITSGKFIINKLETLALTIAGEAAKLEVLKGSEAAGEKAAIDNGRIQPSTRTYQKVDHLAVSYTPSGGSFTNLEDSLEKISIELQNDISWTPYTTVNDALNVTNVDNLMYPSNFTVKKKSLSGSISRYVIDTDSEDDLQSWKTNVAMVIEAGSSNATGFKFTLNNCTFTNRVNVAEVFTQSYDWKMNDNSASLTSGIIKFNNTTV